MRPAPRSVYLEARPHVSPKSQANSPPVTVLRVLAGPGQDLTHYTCPLPHNPRGIPSPQGSIRLHGIGLDRDLHNPPT